MASSTSRGPGGQGQQTGMHGAACSTPTTQGQRLESAVSSGSATTGIMDKAQELASNVGNKASEAWDSTRQGVQQAASRVANTAEETFDSVTSFMCRYPIATLCVGFGLGFLVGRLIARGGLPELFGGSRANWWDEDARQARTYGRYNQSSMAP